MLGCGGFVWCGPLLWFFSGVRDMVPIDNNRSDYGRWSKQKCCEPREDSGLDIYLLYVLLPVVSAFTSRAVPQRSSSMLPLLAVSRASFVWCLVRTRIEKHTRLLSDTDGIAPHLSLVLK